MTYQPKTGAPCTCKRGVQRDNCPTCEGTGQVIDFKAIHREREERERAARERALIPPVLAFCGTHGCRGHVTVTLHAPDGDRVPGGYCGPCALRCALEYAEKLGEVWTIRPIPWTRGA